MGDVVPSRHQVAQLQQARDDLEEVVDHLRASDRRGARDFAGTLHNLAVVYVRLGDLGHARTICEESAAVASQEFASGADPHELDKRAKTFVRSFDRLAEINARLGDAEGALDAVEAVRSATIRRATSPESERKESAEALFETWVRRILRTDDEEATRLSYTRLHAARRLAGGDSSLLPEDAAFVSIVVLDGTVTAIVVLGGRRPRVQSHQWRLDQLPMQSLAQDPELRPGVFRLRRLEDLVAETSTAFFERIRPVLEAESVSRLAVSAPGIVARIPFEAVARQHKVTQLPSLLSGINLADRARSWNPESLLIVGYRDDDLPRVATEIRTLTELWTGHVTVVDVDRCTKRDVLEQLDQGYDLVHFTCHGTFDFLSPLDSALHFSSNPTSDRYRLTARDLLSLTLAGAPVVTLSACSTALTSYGPAHDCTGLTGSFLRAGARAVIATRWPVYDPTAERFMTQFYDVVGTCSDPRLAFHAAQEALRRDTSIEDWGAFGYLGA